VFSRLLYVRKFGLVGVDLKAGPLPRLHNVTIISGCTPVNTLQEDPSMRS